MAAVSPLFMQNRTPLQQVTLYATNLTTTTSAIDASSDSDSNVSSSSFEVNSASDEESDSDSVSDSELIFSVSNQGDERTRGHFLSDNYQDPEVTSSHQHSQTLTGTLVRTVGDMARTDNVGYIAWLVPLTGLSAMVGTEVLACAHHFTCSENYPTLSYAATFRPEGYVFALGMCLTALFILASIVLFFWYVQLRMRTSLRERPRNDVMIVYACLGFGVSTSLSLIGLAVLDMRAYHDAHILSTIVFFLSSWVMIVTVQIVRKRILHPDDNEKASLTANVIAMLRRRSFWLALRRWRRLDHSTAYTLGHLFVHTGLASSLLFAIFFLCANDVWPNPLGFTAVQEAFFEALAIVCQLLFMGTLSSELARLARLVEDSDYAELERYD